MIRFQAEPHNGFYETLRQRAAVYFSTNGLSKTGAWQNYVKAFLLLTLYGGSYAMIYSSQWFVLFYAAMGFLTVPIILNIGHEAVHDTFSPYPRLNRILANVFNLTGADSTIWRKRHIESHHVFTNTPGFDSDIAQSKLARIAPVGDFLPAHRYQHWYMPFLYLIYTLNWLLFRDFKDCRELYGGSTDYARRFAILISSKVFFFGYSLALPLWFFPDKSGAVLLGFMVMQMVMSATTFLVLASAHIGEHAIFPSPDASGYLPHSWAEHQLLTTTDFAPESKLLLHFFGGFNHHVAHHLFPRITHTHYPALTRITRETAAEFGLEYRCFPSLLNSVVSHFRLLKKNSFPLLVLE